MDRIEEIRCRLNATTKGKWIAKGIPYYGEDDPIIATEDGIYIAQTVYDMQSMTKKHNVDEDTIFIVHAKEDIEYLLNLLDNIKRSHEKGINIIIEKNSDIAIEGNKAINCKKDIGINDKI